MKYKGIDSWVSVFDASTVDEAKIIKGMLEASKIPVILDREAGSLPGYAEGPDTEVVVKVPKEMVAKAAQLLQSGHYGISLE